MSVMYAIVCSESTKLVWSNALSKLKQKYEAEWPGRVHIILYNPSTTILDSCVREKLSRLKPKYSCFLAYHSECTKLFIQEVNQVTRDLDPTHPYTDTIWGILTGLTEEDVLSSLDQKPLTISRVVSNCPVDLEKFRSGVWFSESEQGSSYRKTSHQGGMVKEKCPDDTTELIVQEISDERDHLEDSTLPGKGVDMVISSGHATESDWNIGYCFRGGKFLCAKGQLYGSSLDGMRVDVQRTKSAKILSAAGNCLMGHISDKNCMALGWMHSANVVQMVGYVEPTWYGYGGWGVHKYFINNPGSKSFAESFFANQQSLIYELHTKYKDCFDVKMKDHRSVYDKCFNTSASASEGMTRDCSGLVYDRDNVAFYGDPAWKAHLETNHPVNDYTCSLEEFFPSPHHIAQGDGSWHYWKFSVSILRTGQWNCPIPNDNDTCPGRPPVFIFPQRLFAPQVIEGESSLVLTEMFLLLPLSGQCKPGDEHQVLFRSKIQQL